MRPCPGWWWCNAARWAVCSAVCLPSIHPSHSFIRNPPVSPGSSEESCPALHYLRLSTLLLSFLPLPRLLACASSSGWYTIICTRGVEERERDGILLKWVDYTVYLLPLAWLTEEEILSGSLALWATEIVQELIMSLWNLIWTRRVVFMGRRACSRSPRINGWDLWW